MVKFGILPDGSAVSGKVTVTGLDVSSVQGDKQILAILKEMGAEITVEQGSITVKRVICTA